MSEFYSMLTVERIRGMLCKTLDGGDCHLKARDWNDIVRFLFHEIAELEGMKSAAQRMADKAWAQEMAAIIKEGG